MKKNILITGSTDGIGLETARRLHSLGHRVWLHGRNQEKLDRVLSELSGGDEGERVEGFTADLSVLDEVAALADEVAERIPEINVLINNAGVFTMRSPKTVDGLDARFAVNVVAPYLLTKRLMGRLGGEGRVVNLSSAAQSPVDLVAMVGLPQLSDGPAYAQSKLALTMWTRALGSTANDATPVLVAVNPGSMLATKMVKDAYGVAGANVGKGADILCRAALDDEFAGATGMYFDNDSGRFADPHPSALMPGRCEAVVEALDSLLSKNSGA